MRNKFAINESVNCAPFSTSADLKESKLSFLSDNAIMNSAKSLSLKPKWFSNSVHTFDTSDKNCNFSNSSIIRNAFYVMNSSIKLKVSKYSTVLRDNYQNTSERLK